jgi:REP element-mobilizing transposase RayT
MNKFKNKYRIPAARAAWWNYGWAAAYVITICTKNRNHYFSEIRPETADHSRNKMILSNCGILVDVSWYEILKHTKNVELGAFTVMPNHMHGILILNSDFHTLIDASLDI